MSVFDPKIQNILVFDPSQARATVSAYTEKVPLKDSSIEASLFLLSEIRNNTHSNNQRVIKILQEKLLQEFLNHPAPVTESSFEEVLHNVNKIFPTIIDTLDQGVLKDISLVAGVITGNTIHFSQVGPATLLFIQHGKISDLSDHELAQPVNPLKVFKEITTGKLEDTDILFVSTTNFLDYFSQEKIRRILESTIDKSVATGFEEFLMQAPLNTSFAGFAIAVKKQKVTSVDEYISSNASTEPSLEEKKNTSMEQLIYREEETEKIMSPRLLPYVAEKIKKTILLTRLSFKKYILRKPTRISPILTEQKEREPGDYVYQRRTGSSAPSITKKVASKTKKAGSAVIGKLTTSASKTFQSLRSKTSKIDMGPTVTYPQKHHEKFNILKLFSALSVQRKIVIIVIILLVALFAQSIVFSGIRSEQQNRTKTQQAQEEAIKQAMSEIDAAILYGDDNRIQEAVQSLESQLANLDKKTYGDLISQTEDAINEAKQKLQRIKEIPKPAQVASWSDKVESNPLISLALYNGMLFSLDPANNQISTAEASTGVTNVISTNDAVPQYMATTNSGIFVVSRDFNLYKVTNTSTTVQSLPFGGSDHTYNIAAIASYLDRLYLIDITQNQILVGARYAGGIGNPTTWLDSPIDMSNATSMAIDGQIYVGFKDGTIKKFLRGTEQSFTLAKLQEPIKQLAQLWATESSDTLYVLDTGINRILKFNKNNGSLIEQLRFPSLSQIDAFAVDEDAGVFYLLSGQTLYSSPLS